MASKKEEKIHEKVRWIARLNIIDTWEELQYLMLIDCGIPLGKKHAKILFNLYCQKGNKHGKK